MSPSTLSSATPPTAVSQTPMTTTTTISPTPPATSSADPSTSPSVASTPTTTSSNVIQSITSTSVRSSTSIDPATTQTSAETSSSRTVSLSSMTASSAPASTTLSASTTSTTPSSSPPDSPSPIFSATKTNLPLTTVLENTTIFVTSTNSQRQTLTNAPPVVTEVITTTGSGGIAATITQVVVNPTLAPNNSTAEGSSFFANTGAVVGVFVVVGLATASIMMWIFFAMRRRLRVRGIEEDMAVEAAVAAAGLNRAPLDDDDDPMMSPNAHHYQFSPEMGHQSTLLGLGDSGSLPTTRLSEALDDPTRDGVSSRPGSPMGHCPSSRRKGYLPARTTSPSPHPEQGLDDLASSRDRKSSYGHTPTYSAGSFEPLLASYVQNASDHDTSAATREQPRGHSSQRPDFSRSRKKYSSDASPEDVSRASMKRQNSSNCSVPPREENDNARHALTVRNVPDNQSQHSL